MKTPEAVKRALNKYKEQLDETRATLADLDNAWVRAGAVMDNKEFMVACAKQAEEMRRLESELDFKIRFAQWILDEKEQQ